MNDLSLIELKALEVFRDYGEMTTYTARKLGIEQFAYKLKNLGLLYSFHLVTDEWYSVQEQNRIGIHGGLGKAGSLSLRHTSRTYKITVKGHMALRRYIS